MRMMALFSREGDACFCGHLDIVRAMQRALRRSDLPVAYSQGFSPHMLITFASAMPVGLQTEADIMEVTMAEPVSGELFMQTLSQVMPMGIRIVAARPMAEGEGKTMARLAACRYSVRVQGDYVEKAKALWASSECMMEKKSKSSVKLMNIREMIYALRAEFDGQHTTLNMTLQHNNEQSLKPEVVLQALEEGLVAEHVCRTGMLCRDGEGNLVGLLSQRPGGV